VGDQAGDKPTDGETKPELDNAGGGQVDVDSRAASVESWELPAGEWPFSKLVEAMGVDLFSPSWEVRHGAAMGLREILKTQGAAGGMLGKYCLSQSII
jgi:TATA-binding protein-associated factor